MQMYVYFLETGEFLIIKVVSRNYEEGRNTNLLLIFMYRKDGTVKWKEDGSFIFFEGTLFEKIRILFVGGVLEIKNILKKWGETLLFQDIFGGEYDLWVHWH